MSLTTLGPKYSTVPKLVEMRDSLAAYRGKTNELRKEVKGKVGSVEAIGFAHLGTALCGLADSRGWSDQTKGMVAVGALVAGYFLQQPSLMHLASGFGAPVTYEAARSWGASTWPQLTTQAA